ncbi:MAG: hypothetical protein A2992_00265 [Elusimicrobia bacterium RIFCSPLOWO2_01_FULL_59_12]|nr:MAG: hypothetical protein A2992_00265 [Elusimicrobia bacterium RIFCSPLOWO2_01_FULL_59_12]
MAKLRVAHIITQLELGGAQRNTLYTVTHLNPERFEPCLLHGPGGILDKEAADSGVHAFIIPALVRSAFQPLNDVRALIHLYKRLRAIQPDIVHTHSSKAGILGRIAAYFAGVPVILHTFHGFGFTPRQHVITRRFFVMLERLCAWLSTHLIFVSEDNRSEAARKGIGLHTPHSLIRSGIAIRPDAPAEPRYQGEEKRRPGREIREKLKIPEDAWVVATVGNLKPQKNTRDVVRIAERALLLAPDIHFLLVGDGEEKEAVKG